MNYHALTTQLDGISEDLDAVRGEATGEVTGLLDTVAAGVSGPDLVDAQADLGAIAYVLLGTKDTWNGLFDEVSAHRDAAVGSGDDAGTADNMRDVEFAFRVTDAVAAARQDAQVLLERHRRGDTAATGQLHDLAEQALGLRNQLIESYVWLAMADAVVDLLYERYAGLVPRFHAVHKVGPVDPDKPDHVGELTGWLNGLTK